MCVFYYAVIIKGCECNIIAYLIYKVNKKGTLKINKNTFHVKLDIEAILEKANI